jgi:GH18 family chitinase
MSDIDWAAMNPIVDIFNLMSYDYYGTWDPVTNHNAPLYASANATQPGFSCSESVNNLLAKNIPANKITMGIAFYGRTQMCTGTPNVYAQGNGQIDPNFAGDSGSPQYYNILAQNSNYDYHWDSVAHVPYLTGKNGHKGFVSFDDTSSIEEKAQFIVQKNLRGAIIWEITGDYIETFAGSGVIAGTPLLDKLNTTLCSGSVAIADAANSYFSIYPNPAHDVLYIQSPAPIPLEIWNIWGQKCLSATVYESLDIHHLPAGVYYAKSKTKGYKFIKQ